MISRRIWQWLAALLMLVGLSACKPDAEFTVTPNPAVAGQEASFDASASKAYREDKGNKITRYDWQFGDGSKASGKLVKHTYAAAGTVKVTLTVVDARGESDVSTQTLVIKPAALQGAVSVRVVSSTGDALKGAKVSLAGVNALTNDQGVALLSGVPTGNDQVVQVSQAGFVNQALRVNLAAGQTAKGYAILKPVGDSLQVKQIELAQSVVSSVLNAQVSFPANAFVTPAGLPATGAVTVLLTPWNIEGADLNAMLGDGNAVDAAGNPTRLISAGMMSVEFLNAAGEKLQLAAGKTAKIRMDLPATSLNGQAIDYDQSIPLWHFDEARALWVEEGAGTVVYSSTSWSGFAVEGTVSHFSTWNWDVKFNGGGTVTVKCVDTAGADVDCQVSADAVLDDGSHLTRSGHVPAGGATIINMPSSGTINWSASTDFGSIGTATSTIGQPVTIVVGAAKTSNFVRCVLADGTAIACQGTVSGTLADGTSVSRDFALPAEGGTIRTSFGVSNLNWSAYSGVHLVAGQFVASSGMATSTISGTVTISLTSDVPGPLPSKTIHVGCNPVASGDAGGATTLTSCTVDSATVSSYLLGVSAGGYYSYDLLATQVSLTPGQTTPVVVPAGLPADSNPTLTVYVHGDDGASPVGFFGYFSELLSNLADGSVRLITLMWAGETPV